MPAIVPAAAFAVVWLLVVVFPAFVCSDSLSKRWARALMAAAIAPCAVVLVVAVCIDIVLVLKGGG